MFRSFGFPRLSHWHTSHSSHTHHHHHHHHHHPALASLVSPHSRIAHSHHLTTSYERIRYIPSHIFYLTSCRFSVYHPRHPSPFVFVVVYQKLYILCFHIFISVEPCTFVAIRTLRDLGLALSRSSVLLLQFVLVLPRAGTNLSCSMHHHAHLYALCHTYAHPQSHSFVF